MKLEIIIVLKSSHKDDDYNSCDAENSETHCLICDSDKHRVLLSSPGPSKCMC